MNKKRTSYAFLMEMLWVCGFFTLAACVFVLAFVKADRLSKSADYLNHSVIIAENAIEDTFAEYHDAFAPEETLTGFDRNWKVCEPDAPQTAFVLQTSVTTGDGLLHVTASVSEIKKDSSETIYTLSGMQSLSAERRSR